LPELPERIPHIPGQTAVLSHTGYTPEFGEGYARDLFKNRLLPAPRNRRRLAEIAGARVVCPARLSRPVGAFEF
jgi:hypothetical protein